MKTSWEIEKLSWNPELPLSLFTLYICFLRMKVFDIHIYVKRQGCRSVYTAWNSWIYSVGGFNFIRLFLLRR